jgi:hypothetical protein
LAPLQNRVVVLPSLKSQSGSRESAEEKLGTNAKAAPLRTVGRGRSRPARFGLRAAQENWEIADFSFEIVAGTQVSRFSTISQTPPVLDIDPSAPAISAAGLRLRAERHARGARD